jgi:protein TonB
VLSGLLVLHQATPRDLDELPIAVTLTAESAAQRVARAGVDWDSDAGKAAIAALLESRRSAALMDELVVRPASRARPPGRPAAAARPDPAPSPRPEHPPATSPAELGPPDPTRLAGMTPAPTPPAPEMADPPALAAPSPPPSAPPTRLPRLASADPAPPSLPVPPPTPARAVEAPVRTSEAPAPPAQGAAATSQAPQTATLPPARPVADAKYLDAVLRRLQRIKHYPVHASGRVFLAFTVARDGTVLNAEVRQSSGQSVLDRAGVELIYRASPLPPLPASIPGDSFVITIPVQFLYD